MGKRKGDIEIGHRMLEELHRMYGTNSSVVKNFGCNYNTMYSWEMGSTPGGAVLAKLHYVGGDVLYVLTGKRGA